MTYGISKHFKIQSSATGYYCTDVYADTKAKALAWYKQQWQLNRMPSGYAIWEA